MFAPSFTDQIGHIVHGLGLADVPAKLDLHFSDVRLPVAQDLLRFAKPGDLARVVADGRLQLRDLRIDRLFTVFVRIEEFLASSEQEPAHAGFHVDSRGDDTCAV